VTTAPQRIPPPRAGGLARRPGTPGPGKEIPPAPGRAAPGGVSPAVPGPAGTGLVTAAAAPRDGGLDRLLEFGGGVGCPLVTMSGLWAWDDLARRVTALGASSVILVSSFDVPRGVRDAARRALLKAAPVEAVIISAGETARYRAPGTFTGYVLSRARATGASPRPAVVALGDSLVGDVAAAVAALLEGQPSLVSVPTTFEAVIRGTGRPAAAGRAAPRCAPSVVWVHLDVLRDLPPDEIRAALCLAIGDVMTVCPDRAGELRGMLRPDARYRPGEVERAVEMCLDARQPLLAADPDAAGPAMALAYGATAGHALTLLGLSCGFATGIGGLVADYAAWTLGLLDHSAVTLHEELLMLAGAPARVPTGLPAGRLPGALRAAGQRGRLPVPAGHVGMVLLAAPGRLHRPGGEPVTPVPETVLLQAAGRLVRA
jgi:3-dehydroquinate synthetase